MDEEEVDVDVGERCDVVDNVDASSLVEKLRVINVPASIEDELVGDRVVRSAGKFGGDAEGDVDANAVCVAATDTFASLVEFCDRDGTATNVVFTVFVTVTMGGDS